MLTNSPKFLQILKKFSPILRNSSYNFLQILMNFGEFMNIFQILTIAHELIVQWPVKRERNFSFHSKFKVMKNSHILTHSYKVLHILTNSYNVLQHLTYSNKFLQLIAYPYKFLHFITNSHKFLQILSMSYDFSQILSDYCIFLIFPLNPHKLLPILLNY